MVWALRLPAMSAGPDANRQVSAASAARLKLGQSSGEVQDATLQRLEAYLGFPLARIIVRPEAVGRYDGADGVSYFEFLDEGMAEFNYPIPH